MITPGPYIYKKSSHFSSFAVGQSVGQSASLSGCLSAAASIFLQIWTDRVAAEKTYRTGLDL